MLSATIDQLITQRLHLTDQFIIDNLCSDVPLIQEVVAYVTNSGGKRLRPKLLLLAAQAINNQDDRVLHLAAVVELIHTATLMHDDVVDQTTLRRGRATANHVWNNAAAVLIGDFLYSRAFQIVVSLNNSAVIELFAAATHYIAEGEVLQLQHAFDLAITEEQYFSIIQRKTAKLFTLAASLSAVSSTELAIAQYAVPLEQYGVNFGLAYQLIDDLLDYTANIEQAGKNVGHDLAEGKITLPLIYMLRHNKDLDRQELVATLQEGNGRKLRKIRELVAASGGIDYTVAKASSYLELACDSVVSLPCADYRQGLVDFALSILPQFTT